MSFSNDDAICREFLATWPIERLRTMALSDYTGLGNRETFTFWMESRLDRFGSIWGGSSFKFGIFARNAKTIEKARPGLSYDEFYGWYQKYGNDAAAAFESVRAEVLKVAEAAKNGHLADIDAVDLGDTYKWKIAFHYQSMDAQKIVCIFQRRPLLHALGRPLTDRQTPLSALYKELGEMRPPDESIVDFSARLWQASALAMPYEIRLPEPAVKKGLLPISLGAAPFPSTMHGSKDAAAEQRATFRTDTGLTFESDIRVTAPGKGVLRRNVGDYFTQIGAAKDTPLVITPEADGSYSIRRKGASTIDPGPVNPPPPLPPVPPKPVLPAPQRVPLNQILFGPPGTGKTFHAIDKALEILDPSFLHEHRNNRPSLKARFDALASEGLVQFVTFHQSFSYEDFVEGLRAESDGETGTLRYEVADGVFKRLCEAAQLKTVKQAEAPIDLTGRRFWKLSLGDSSTQRWVFDECVRNGYALLGYGAGLDFSQCGDREDIRRTLEKAGEVHGSADYPVTAVNTFKHLVRKGDLIVVTEGNLKFRAIGEVTGDYRYLPRETDDTFAQCRDVKWLRVYAQARPYEDLMANRFSQMTLYELREGSIELGKLQALLQLRPAASAETSPASSSSTRSIAGTSHGSLVSSSPSSSRASGQGRPRRSRSPYRTPSSRSRCLRTSTSSAP